ncbi:glutaredoxin family protein [Brevibacillus marinus]|jgi:glutaredoxin|uniref:glutaredoxin family protein n=1 Tax=Brevibacillus marinus TaxID=2496837 RepID=UPI000F84C651|nr:glutaredoxin family protein [Brevibacillus marinus]
MMKAIVYTSSTCTFCKQVKQYLQEQNLPYEERNIDENPAYGEELARMGIMSVPLTVIGEKQILGFNPGRIQKAIAELANRVEQ